MDVKTKKFGLTGNALKIIAIISMTIDHIGVQLVSNDILRIIGRLAFPIFAYMIAEGCRYTRNRRKYALTIGAVAAICQIVYYFAMGSLYQCIFVTFLLSVLLIYAMDNAVKKQDVLHSIYAVLFLIFVVFVTEYLPQLLDHTDFAIDYGFCGVMVPVLVYFACGKYMKLVAAALGLVILSITYGGIQWYSLLSVPLLALYNGERGRLKMKWFFYIYYPLHLGVIYLISLLMN